MTHAKLQYSAIICSILLAGSMMTGTAFAAEIPDAASVRALQSYLLKETAPPDGADADRNGILNAADLTLLKRQVLSGDLPFSGDASALRINEICASNKTAYAAPDGSSPDWIELYNSSSDPLSLDGIGLSDGKKNRYSFVFPAGTVLEGGGCLLIQCGGELHDAEPYAAPFKLSASGETLYLTAPAASDGSAGETLDQVTFPMLDTDVTYGRSPDGSDQWKLLSPTAGRANTSAEQVQVNAPEFSEKPGFYDDAFLLTLTADDGCTILYTTDGSDPRSSETAMQYTDRIRIYNKSDEMPRLSQNPLITENNLSVWSTADEKIDQCMVVRAVSQDADGSFSRTVTGSYFVGLTASFYQDMKVVSITANEADLVDPETGILGYPNCHEHGGEWERPVNIQVFDKGKSDYSADVGMRVSGNFSRYYAQKSLTFYARSKYGPSKMRYDFFDGAARDCDGQKIKEFDAVTLRNGGSGYDEIRFRDDLNAELASGLDIATQAKNYCVAFINGEFWGMYALQERLNEDYVEAHYHVDADNVTTIKNNAVDGDAELLDAFFELYKWLKHAYMSDPENYARACAEIDMQSFIDFCAVQSYICNWDSLLVNNNIMLWRATVPDPDVPYADGKWRFMLFDTEWSAGFLNSGNPDDDYLRQIANGEGQFWFEDEEYDMEGRPGIIYSKIFESLIRNRDFAEQFRASNEKIANENFAWERVEPLIDAYNERINDAFEATARRFGIFDRREERLPQMRDFYRTRGEYAIRCCDELMQYLFG